MSKLYLGAREHSIKLMAHHSHLQHTFALPERASLTTNQLAELKKILTALFQDENFVTLLRAESFTKIPEYLNEEFELARDRK